jgi:hypothetical protein
MALRKMNWSRDLVVMESIRPDFIRTVSVVKTMQMLRFDIVVEICGWWLGAFI